MSTPTVKYEPSIDIQHREDFSHLLFARGFILTSEVQVPGPHWTSTAAGRGELSWDRRSDLVRVGENNIVLLGHAIHLRESTDDLRTIAESLYEARMRSRDDFLEELSWLAGRYVVIDDVDGEAWLQTDAAATRSVYYHAERRVIASHQNLVSELCGGLAPSTFGSVAWKRANKTAVCYPGNKTHWEGVNFLNANQELNLDTFEVRRIKMRPPSDLSIDQVTERVLDLIRLQIPFLTANEKPVVSLTAGQDSRTTLAMLRPAKNSFHYFTYALNYSRRIRAVKLDVEGGHRLVEHAGLSDYRLLNLEGPLEAGPLRDVLQRNSVKSSNLNVAAKYLSEFAGSRMHVRSSFNEVGIAAYRAKHGNGPVDATVLAGILTFGQEFTAETVQACQDYIDLTGLLEVEGYDPLDLHYWEVRMGSWLGTLIQESDIAFDTHILINSREIVRLLLSAPLGERMLGNTYHRLIERTWPELYEIPVNGVYKSFPSNI